MSIRPARMAERSGCPAGRSAIGRRLHRGADLALAFADDVDERLTVERQHYCPPQFGVVEGRDRAVDDRGTAGIPAGDLAVHFGRLALDFLQERYGTKPVRCD